MMFTGFKRGAIGFVGVVALAAVVNFWHLDGLGGWLWATFYGDDTEYAQGYSDAAYRRIQNGSSEGQLVQSLGLPLRQAWRFEPVGREYVQISFDRDGRVEHVVPVDQARLVGMSIDEVRGLLGQPDLKIYRYSTSPNDGSYRYRVIHLRQGKVVDKLHGYGLD